MSARPPVKRILVAQTAFLGDLVLTQPLVEELSRHFAAPVDLLVRKPFAELARSFRGVSDVISFDKRGADRGLGGILRQRKDVASRGYDLAIAAHGSMRTAMVLMFARIPRRIGRSTAEGRRLFHVLSPDVRGKPYTERLRGLAIAAGAGPGSLDPVLDVTPAAKTAMDERLAAAGIGAGERVVAINPGSVWGTKRWLPEGYGAVAAEIAKRGLRVIVVGGKEDMPVAKAVTEHAGGAALNLAGTTTIPELVALSARASVFVSGDSGPMHIAAAVGTPVVAIFGPTTPALGFGPRIAASEIVEIALECRPCHLHGPEVCPLGHFRCMREIAPATVLSAFERLVDMPKRQVERS